MLPVSRHGCLAESVAEWRGLEDLFGQRSKEVQSRKVESRVEGGRWKVPTPTGRWEEKWNRLSDEVGKVRGAGGGAFR